MFKTDKKDESNKIKKIIIPNYNKICKFNQVIQLFYKEYKYHSN